ncbi:MAG: hypothetical protein A2W31_00065 [Planctomycetes bacterium RBG_16_64_10]|nr:MAG: hypothetical protein A2W31_00065 [Planctomycetes bacterium RBG_16_64_10]
MLGKLDQARSAVEKALYGWGILRAHRLPLPDFLGIGVQKAGTTWLYRNLTQHPELFLPEPKELHYFDWNFRNSLRSYSRHFAPGVGRVKGEITPNYCTLPVARIAFVRQILPHVRLILLLRNPVERAWSQAVMNLVEKTGRAFDQVADDEFLRHFEHQRSVARGDYLANLDRWRQFFPEQHFFCGFFESITERPQVMLAEIFRFLGVSTAVDWDRFPVTAIFYPGVGVPLPDRFRQVLLDRYRSDIEQLYARFGAPVAGWRVPAS